MNLKLVHEDGMRNFVAVLNKGEESVTALTGFAEREGMQGPSLSAIGAFRRATLGYFDRDTTSYVEIAVDEQVEVLSLLGDVAMAGDRPKLHAHVVLGRSDGTTCGGHLLNGEVWPTLEVVLTETPAYLRRRHDPETGLALIDLEH